MKAKDQISQDTAIDMESPAGLVELEDDALANVSGGVEVVVVGTCPEICG